MQNLNGEYSEKLKKIFYQLSLEKYLLRKLKSRKWYIVAQGLRESRIMGYKDALNVARKNVNARRLELRVEAQISVMALKEEDPSRFLEQLKRPFSTWARINLYQEVSGWDDKPDARKWLRSNNPGVVAYALRVMTIFGQEVNPKDIIELMEIDDPRVRAELVWYSAAFLDSDLWNRCAMRFRNETTEVRLVIAKTSSMMPNVPVKLLVSWFNSEHSSTVKIELARALFVHGQGTEINKGDLDVIGIVA